MVKGQPKPLFSRDYFNMNSQCDRSNLSLLIKLQLYSLHILLLMSIPCMLFNLFINYCNNDTPILFKLQKPASKFMFHNYHFFHLRGTFTKMFYCYYSPIICIVFVTMVCLLLYFYNF